jgi:2-dehydropantoate 2-reductase
MIRNIGILGTGGVGGFFGGKLCLGADIQTKVCFLARGRHLEEIKEHGLTLKTEKEGELLCRPALATNSIDQLPALDLCLLSVKGFDLLPLLHQLKDRVSEETVLLPLLNGVDIYDRVRSVIDKGIILPACVYVGTHIERPGVVAQNGGACKILFGPDPKHRDYAPEALLQLFRRAGILHDWKHNISTSIWGKFIFIASFGIVTAAHDKTIGEVLDDEELRDEVMEIMNEIISIAPRVGVSLPSNTTETAMKKGMTFPYETRTSFQRDFAVGSKADERDLFAGAILNLAKDLGLEAPKTEELLAKLEQTKPSSNKAIEGIS